MAVRPDTTSAAADPCRLAPFQVAYADRVLSWIRTAEEAFWLAPRTKPPLTAEEVLHWQTPGHRAFLLYRRRDAEPRGYGELNQLQGFHDRYWLGHLIVDPDCRGAGLGRQLTRLLLAEAFQRHRARDVTLVVFPDNRQAIACYRAAGMRTAGYETHDFPAYQKRVRLLRMVADGLTG
jgi:ribosomal protein S18 acetylase RimI-like enzyme